LCTIDDLKFNQIPLTPIYPEKWNLFKRIKDAVNASLETLRANKIIAKNSQAIVAITFNNYYKFLPEELKIYLNVAKVIINSVDTSDITVKSENANFVRCERCWNYYEKEKINDQQLCERCAKIV
jgi:isoleucyl-tRNA synthetase